MGGRKKEIHPLAHSLNAFYPPSLESLKSGSLVSLTASYLFINQTDLRLALHSYGVPAPNTF